MRVFDLSSAWLPFALIFFRLGESCRSFSRFWLAKLTFDINCCNVWFHYIHVTNSLNLNFFNFILEVSAIRWFENQLVYLQSLDTVISFRSSSIFLWYNDSDFTTHIDSSMWLQFFILRAFVDLKKCLHFFIGNFFRLWYTDLIIRSRFDKQFLFICDLLRIDSFSEFPLTTRNFF